MSTENDMNVLVRGVRLILKLAHTDPVASKLALRHHGINASSPWWPGVADPNQVCLSVSVQMPAVIARECTA